MKQLTRHWLVLLMCLGAWPSVALAQGLAPRPGGMGQTPPKSETPSGPAEAAEETKDETQPDLPPFPPWPGEGKKQLQLFQLRGYFRMRGDMFHNANLGMYDGKGFKAPFYTAVSEGLDLHGNPSPLNCQSRKTTAVAGGTVGDRSNLDDGDCPAKTLAGANMRLRLEPTINVGEQVRIHAQLDVFDNLVLGSTPAVESEGAGSSQLTLFQDSQATPIAGQNATSASIMVKRAWAEVDTPFGELSFGRMPVQWGLGMLANDGHCWDCDWGDNSDRIMFKANLAGYTLGMGYDFHANGPTSLSVNPGFNSYGGQAIDLEQLDDVNQLFWIVGRIDPEEVIKDRVDRGQLVLNYGLYFVWRKQDFDYGYTSGGKDQTGNNYASVANSTAADLTGRFIERHGWTLMPDLWFKLQWKKLQLELEGLLIGGRIGNVSDVIASDAYTILQYGWVLRSSYKVLNDSLSFGMEIGMASGDQAEPANADVNRRRYSPLGLNANGSRIDQDGALNEFRFNYDYHVDLLLFREILGTVSNAVYFKPWIQYLVVESFGARLDAMYAMTHQPVAYPGNSRNLGVELDLDIFYRNIAEKFSAGLAYGVLFPLDALDRPEYALANGRQLTLFGPDAAANAEIAHTLQARLIVKF